MAQMPESVAAFLAGKHIAVAGVSREPKGHVGNAIFKKLKSAGYDVVPVNHNASRVEGETCYRDIASIPGNVDSVMIATKPDAALGLVRQCAGKGVKHIWFHKAIGTGAGTNDAITEAKKSGIAVIANGCPMMFVEPVDGGHKLFCWWLGLFGKVPK